LKQKPEQAVGFLPKSPELTASEIEKGAFVMEFLEEVTDWVEEEAVNPKRIFTSEARELLGLIEVDRVLATFRDRLIIIPNDQSPEGRREYLYTPPELALYKLLLILGDKGCDLKIVVEKLKLLLKDTDYTQWLGSPSSSMKPGVRKLSDDNPWLVQYGNGLISALDLTPGSHPPKRKEVPFKLTRKGPSSNFPITKTEEAEGNIKEVSEEQILDCLNTLESQPGLDYFSPQKLPGDFPFFLVDTIIRRVLEEKEDKVILNFLRKKKFNNFEGTIDNLTFSEAVLFLKAFLRIKKIDVANQNTA